MVQFFIHSLIIKVCLTFDVMLIGDQFACSSSSSVIDLNSRVKQQLILSGMHVGAD